MGNTRRKKVDDVVETAQNPVILSKAKDPIPADRITVVERSSLGSAQGLRMKEHQYFVYIMSSRSGTLYIGMTNSIYRRALQHKTGQIEGFASKYHCTRLVHCESFDDVHRAIGREKELKGWTRAKKIALIESTNPRWTDLAEHWGAQMLFAGESMKGK